MDYRQQRYGRIGSRRPMGSYQNTSHNFCSPGDIESECRSHKYGFCDDKYADKCLEQFPLAMAYVPFQKFRKVFDASTGLEHGTIFEELVLPFCGYKGACGMRGDRS